MTFLQFDFAIFFNISLGRCRYSVSLSCILCGPCDQIGQFSVIVVLVCLPSDAPFSAHRLLGFLLPRFSVFPCAAVPYLWHGYLFCSLSDLDDLFAMHRSSTVQLNELSEWTNSMKLSHAAKDYLLDRRGMVESSDLNVVH